MQVIHDSLLALSFSTSEDDQVLSNGGSCVAIPLRWGRSECLISVILSIYFDVKPAEVFLVFVALQLMRRVQTEGGSIEIVIHFWRVVQL